MWNNRSNRIGVFSTPTSRSVSVPIYQEAVKNTEELDKIYDYVFSKFDKMILVIPESNITTNSNRYKQIPHNSTHDMQSDIRDKTTDILPILKKYLPKDYFDRSGYYIQCLYDHITANRPFTNDMDNKAYFDTYVKDTLRKIYNGALSYKGDRFASSSCNLQSIEDDRNKQCNLFLTDLLKAIDEDAKSVVVKVVKTEEVVKKEVVKTEVVKKKKKVISATIKKLVWNTNIGEEIGKAKCLCCNSTDITQMSFNCGHIIAEANGGDTIVSNLKPICQNCNSSMGTKNMNDFMKTLK